MRFFLLKRILVVLFTIKMLQKITSLWIFLPKMSAYRGDFDKTKCMSFLIKDEELLEKQWDLEKCQQHLTTFDSKPVYNGKISKN